MIDPQIRIFPVPVPTGSRRRYTVTLQIDGYTHAQIQASINRMLRWLEAQPQEAE